MLSDVVAQPTDFQVVALMQAGYDGTPQQPLILLGTAAGDVKACLAATGKLLWRASAVNAG